MSANQGDNSVSVLAIAKIVYNKSSDEDNIQTVKVRDAPVSIAINPKTHMVYVANYNDNSISVINGTGSKKKVIDTIQVGLHPSDIAINPAKNLLYVS